jgi:hypothetical protein
MDAGNYKRNTILDCVVTGHATYGVLVTTPSGAPGWIESEYLGDEPALETHWPAIGTTVTAAVLGPMTNDGRWRLCARPTFLAETRNESS